MKILNIVTRQEIEQLPFIGIDLLCKLEKLLNGNINLYKLPLNTSPVKYD